MPADFDERPPRTAASPVEQRISSWELYPGTPPYSEHRTVTAVLAVERVSAWELYPGTRQRRVEVLERKAHENNKPPQGVSFAQLLEDKKQKPPP